jgi:NADPH:quinone reductase
MKAVRVHEFGPASGLRYEEVPDPMPGPDEVVIRVQAAGVNPADYKFRSGALTLELRRPFTLGMDVAGVVCRVGDSVTSFAVGERVLAMLYLMGNGGYAEQVALPAAWCAHLPDDLNPVSAATLPTPATTAVEWIEDAIRAQPGMRLLVSGATGAVGTIACYIARQHGAHVMAVVRQSQRGLVRYVDEVMALDSGERPRTSEFDCIADTIGGSVARGLLPMLKLDGLLSTIATDPIDTSSRPDVRLEFFGNKPDAGRLGRLASAVAAGELVIPSPRVMPLKDAAAAHTLLERGGAGKIVLVPDASS